MDKHILYLVPSLLIAFGSITVLVVYHQKGYFNAKREETSDATTLSDQIAAFTSSIEQDVADLENKIAEFQTEAIARTEADTMLINKVADNIHLRGEALLELKRAADAKANEREQIRNEIVDAMQSSGATAAEIADFTNVADNAEDRAQNSLTAFLEEGHDEIDHLQSKLADLTQAEAEQARIDVQALADLTAELEALKEAETVARSTDTVKGDPKVTCRRSGVPIHKEITEDDSYVLSKFLTHKGDCDTTAHVVTYNPFMGRHFTKMFDVYIGEDRFRFEAPTNISSEIISNVFVNEQPIFPPHDEEVFKAAHVKRDRMYVLKHKKCPVRLEFSRNINKSPTVAIHTSFEKRELKEQGGLCMEN